MKKYSSGERAPHGVYLNITTWELVQLHGGTPVLPGGGQAQYIKVPAALAVAVGPFAGLAFIIFLPLIGIVGVSGLIAYKVGRWAWHRGHRAMQPAAVDWSPGMAYLVGQGRVPNEDEAAAGAGEGLARMENEIAGRRQHGEE